MTDYGCYPLWWDELDQVGDLDPESLPLSQETIQRLYHWADAFEARLNLADPSDSPEVKPEEVEHFEWEGLSLWKQLNQELAPDYEVVYFSSHFSEIFTDSAKLEEKLKLNLMKFNQTYWKCVRENISQAFDQVVANRCRMVIHPPEGESAVLIAMEEFNDLTAIETAHNEKKLLEAKIIREELFSEYHFNHQIVRPNPFSEPITESSITITLDPDVAEVFKTSEDVNDALRYLLSAIVEKKSYGAADY